MILYCACMCEGYDVPVCVCVCVCVCMFVCVRACVYVCKQIMPWQRIQHYSAFIFNIMHV